MHNVMEKTFFRTFMNRVKFASGNLGMVITEKALGNISVMRSDLTPVW